MNLSELWCLYKADKFPILQIGFYSLSSISITSGGKKDKVKYVFTNHRRALRGFKRKLLLQYF